VADDRDRDESREPRIRITDRRRFADLGTQATPGGAPEGAPDLEGRGAPQEPGETPSESNEPDAAELEDDLTTARAEASQYLDHLRRLQAEFDNYRKRVLKEQTQAVELAAEPTMRRLLEVLDDFELALIHATEKPDFDRFLHGVELVYAKLLDALKAEGLERIEAEGRPFDPERHEALMQTGDGDGEPVVADVLRRGYTLKGRVLRPSGVRVERPSEGR
jgi:molecular chaperone GrpE